MPLLCAIFTSVIADLGIRVAFISKGTNNKKNKNFKKGDSLKLSLTTLKDLHEC